MPLNDCVTYPTHMYSSELRKALGELSGNSDSVSWPRHVASRRVTWRWAKLCAAGVRSGVCIEPNWDDLEKLQTLV